MFFDDVIVYNKEIDYNLVISALQERVLRLREEDHDL